MKQVTKEEFLAKVGIKQKAYKTTFGSPGTAAHEAFVDLAKYCHAFGDEFQGNYEQTLRMAGRREAFFHIWRYLNIRSEELAAIYVRLRTGES